MSFGLCRGKSFDDKCSRRCGRCVARIGDTRKRVTVQSILLDRGDDFIEVSAEFCFIGQFPAAACIIDLIEHFRTFLTHSRHIFRIVLREVVGIGQRHDIERVGQATHEILFTGTRLGRVEQTGIDDKMFRLLVVAQRRRIFRPQFWILILRAFDFLFDGFRFVPVFTRSERRGQQA